LELRVSFARAVVVAVISEVEITRRQRQASFFVRHVQGIIELARQAAKQALIHATLPPNTNFCDLSCTDHTCPICFAVDSSYKYRWLPLAY